MPKEKQQIHYIYKIIFLCGELKNRYYLGKRTYNGTDITKDKYHGSGNFCKSYFKKYGIVEGKTYIKEVLEVNDSIEINRNRELVIIGNLWETDPLCMNQRCGGDGGLIKNHNVSEKGKQNISKLNSECVYQFDLDGNLITKFESVIKASKITGVCRSKIVSCCTKQRLTSGGYIWRHENTQFSSEELKEIKKNTKFKSCNKKAVYRIDEMGNKIQYESIREAARKNKIHNSAIYETCSGKRCTAGGYKWKFVEE